MGLSVGLRRASSPGAEAWAPMLTVLAVLVAWP